jgi:hypothetical protein
LYRVPDFVPASSQYFSAGCFCWSAATGFGFHDEILKCGGQAIEEETLGIIVSGSTPEAKKKAGYERRSQQLRFLFQAKRREENFRHVHSKLFLKR